MRHAVPGSILDLPDDIEPGEALPCSVLDQIETALRFEARVPDLPRSQWAQALVSMTEGMIESGYRGTLEEVVQLGQTLPEFCSQLPRLIAAAEAKERTLIALFLREAFGSAVQSS